MDTGKGIAPEYLAPYLRSLFQHQGGRRNGPRAIRQLRHHQEPRRRDPGGEQGRQRHDLYRGAAGYETEQNEPRILPLQ